MPRWTTALPVGLAILEVLHPVWADDSVGDVVQPLAVWWVLLHVSLLIGYLALVVVLWQMTSWVVVRWALVAFAACNSLYLALDGVGVGLLARSDPSAADQLWATSGVTLLADLTGAAWSAALLLIAMSLLRPAADRVVRVGCAITWLVFVASAISDATAAGLLSRVVALGTGAWSVYQRGATRLPIALLIFASVLRQHVGAEAALGMICMAIALATTPTGAKATRRSGPAAASPP